MTTSLLAPSTATASQFICKSGNTYTSDANGVIVGVVTGDILDLMNYGCRPLQLSPTGKNNLTATTNPGATDDSSKDYAVGSLWINTSSPAAFFCTDATASAAVWTQGAPGATTVNAGASGTAGAVNIYPTTASKGHASFTKTDNAGNTTDTITIGAMAGTRTINLKDASTSSGSATLTMLTSAQTSATNGMFANPLRLLSGRNSDCSSLAASASSGKFGSSISLGTSFFLVSESANNNTKTDVVLYEYELPATYVAGTNVTVTVNASITGSGTLTTKTAQIKAYRTASDGTQGVDIGPGSASAMTAAGADITFAVTGTTLSPGDKLVLSLTTILIETASSGMVANINSIRVS